MKDMTIVMADKQGLPADLLGGLREAGVQLTAACIFPRIEGLVAHMTLPDEQVEAARKVVTGLGSSVLDVREVLVIPPEQRPPAAQLAKQLRDAEVSVYISYFGARGELILGTSHLAKARETLGITD